ncbi:MAG: VWA domain-containing protein [Lysobacteraceae bacterium]|nr:MAG: VWA domain-containing protein [Xanthomonadaceae bacterium]
MGGLSKQALPFAVFCALGLGACHTTPTQEVQADTAADRDENAPALVVKEGHAYGQATAKSAGSAETKDDEASGRSDKSKPAGRAELDQLVVTGGRLRKNEAAKIYQAVPAAPPPMAMPSQPSVSHVISAMPAMTPAEPEVNTEKYAAREDNAVQRVSEQPVSTFSIDVDTGSYSNVRRMLRGGSRPPADAVRAEEMINYFDYGHPGPSSLSTPFKVTTELAPAPWNGKRQLLMIGIKGYDVPKAQLPPANLVFLIDTSGSMQSEDKLPLLKQSFAQLVEQLRPQDRVTMVVYAGSAGLVLEPTPGSEKDKILAALDNLQAGGSTNGGAGIQLAYAMAKQAFVKNGVNRVILATDGDFNVGTTDQKALETLVGDQRKHGIALTTLGFGQGNYNDAMAERLADVGDGNHAYIDTPLEARKVLVQEMQSTLLTIAKDVKIQIEFNPTQVAEHRLIGYENRMLRREDFANDKVDAGDIGAGHEVTALYELTLAGSGAERLPALRYARPGEETSKLIETPIARPHEPRRYAPSESLRFAAAVAAYADALRGGKNLDQWGWEDIAKAAHATRGKDPWKQRAEFIELVDTARRLTTGDTPQVGMISD